MLKVTRAITQHVLSKPIATGLLQQPKLFQASHSTFWARSPTLKQDCIDRHARGMLDHFCHYIDKRQALLITHESEWLSVLKKRFTQCKSASDLQKLFHCDVFKQLMDKVTDYKVYEDHPDPGIKKPVSWLTFKSEVETLMQHRLTLNRPGIY